MTGRKVHVQHLTNGARLMASDELSANVARRAAMSDAERNLASYDFSAEAALLQTIVDALSKGVDSPPSKS